MYIYVYISTYSDKTNDIYYMSKAGVFIFYCLR